MIKYKNEGHRKRLRKRFIKSGLKGFLDYEILELLLTYAIPRKDTKLIAKKLFKNFKNIHKIFNVDIKDLQKVEGIGKQAAVFIKLIRDLIIKYFELNNHKKILNFSKELLPYLRAYYHGRNKEVFKTIYFIGSIKVHEEDFGEGTVNDAAAFPRKVVELALKYNAISVIIAHNHPEGNSEPSESDLKITDIIKSALNLVDIKLNDHMIVTNDQIYSFKDNGLLELEICEE